MKHVFMSHASDQKKRKRNRKNRKEHSIEVGKLACFLMETTMQKKYYRRNILQLPIITPSLTAQTKSLKEPGKRKEKERTTD